MSHIGYYRNTADGGIYRVAFEFGLYWFCGLTVDDDFVCDTMPTDMKRTV